MGKILKTIIYNEKEYVVELENIQKSWNISINNIKCSDVKVVNKKRGVVAIVPGSDDKLMVLSNGVTIHILEIDSSVEIEKQAADLLSTGLPKFLDFILFIPFLLVAILLSNYVNVDGSLELHLLTYPTVYLLAIAIGGHSILKPTYSSNKKKLCYFTSVIIAAVICTLYSIIVYCF